jgi:hypothetical protein
LSGKIVATIRCNATQYEDIVHCLCDALSLGSTVDVCCREYTLPCDKNQMLHFGKGSTEHQPCVLEHDSTAPTIEIMQWHLCLFQSSVIRLASVCSCQYIFGHNITTSTRPSITPSTTKLSRFMRQLSQQKGHRLPLQVKLVPACTGRQAVSRCRIRMVPSGLYEI